MGILKLTLRCGRLRWQAYEKGKYPYSKNRWFNTSCCKLVVKVTGWKYCMQLITDTNITAATRDYR